MSSGETAKSTASEDLPGATRDDANATRTETTSDVSEVAKRVADPQHAESAESSFEGSGSAAAAAREEGTSHDAADALDAYARISMPGASVASASDAASSESFLAWLKSDNGGSKRGAVEEPAVHTRNAPAGDSLAIVSSADEKPASALPEAKAKDSGNSLMTQVPSAAEIAAVEASLDVLGLSNPPPPPTRERVAKPAEVVQAADDSESESTRDAGKRTSVEELTADEVIERVSIEPEAPPVPLTRPASVAPPIPLTRPASVAPPPLPTAALNKPPTIAPPPPPKSVAGSEDTDAFNEGPTWISPERPKTRPQRVSAPSLEALAGPVARSTARPPPNPDDPLAMPSLASTAATALSLVPPALPLTERTTEPPPPKSTDKRAAGGLKPPPSPKIGSAPAHEEPRSNGNSLFGGMVGFVLGCIATAMAMKAAAPPPSANAAQTQAAVCAEPTGTTNTAAPPTSAASITTPSVPTPVATPTVSTTATAASTPSAETTNTVATTTDPAVSMSTSSTASTATPPAAVPAVAILPPPSVAPMAADPPPRVNPSVAVTNAAPPQTTVASAATDTDHHHHHSTSDVGSVTGSTSGTASAHTASTATTVTSGSTTNAAPSTAAATPPAVATPHDAEESSTTSCARRCGANADCLIACHRGGAAGSTTSSANHDSAPVANDPPPAAPDHDSPERDEVVDAMGRIREAIVHCATGDENNPTHANQISVTFTFASSGRVTIALVGAPFAGTPAGSCIARAARGAHVEPFAQSSFRVVYPFTL